MLHHLPRRLVLHTRNPLLHLPLPQRAVATPHPSQRRSPSTMTLVGMPLSRLNPRQSQRSPLTLVQPPTSIRRMVEN